MMPLTSAFGRRCAALVLLLAVALSTGVPAQAYEERSAVRTASVCLGVLERLMLIVVLTIPADTPQETRDEVVTFYSDQFDAVADFVEARRKGAGTTNADLGRLIEGGSAYLQAIYESETPPPLQAINDASRPCRDLAAVLPLAEAAVTDKAFAVAAEHYRPLLAD